MAIEYFVKSLGSNSANSAWRVDYPLIVSGLTGLIPNVSQINIDSSLILVDNGSGVVTLTGLTDSLLIHRASAETMSNVKTFIPDQIITTSTIGSGFIII
jgi:hypothetical protein